MGNNLKVLYSIMFNGMLTMSLISAFLSGKIIDIPKGTHEGGVISAVEVGIIIVATTVIGFLFNYFVLKIRRKVK